MQKGLRSVIERGQSPLFIQILYFEHRKAKYKDRDQERTEYNSHKTKQGQTDYYSENRDQRMGIRHFFL